MHLRHLRHVLFSTIREWQDFTSDDGDRGYFTSNHGLSAASQDRVHRYLHDINLIFDALKVQNSKLDDLHDDALKWTKDVTTHILPTCRKNITDHCS